MSKRTRNKPPVKPEQARQPSPTLHQVEVRHQSWQGPLPAPEQLAGYNAVHPGTAERIIRMAEQEGAHLREREMLETKAYVRQYETEEWKAKANVRLHHIGQALAFVFAIVCVVAAYNLAMADHDEVAGILGGATLAAIVVAFLRNKSQK